MAHIKTLKRSHAVIVQQPIAYYEKYKTDGKTWKKGQVKRKRQIQYVEDLETIFVDEQRKLVDNPKPTPIYITRSSLRIPDDNLPMIELLSIHPHNEANGGSLFKFINVEKDELYQIEEFEALDKAREALGKADNNLIRAVAAWFLGTDYISHRIPKLKITLRRKLEMNLKLTDGKTLFVNAFNEFINEKNNQEKLMVTLALSEDVIKILDGKTVAWGNSDDPIYTGSQAEYIVREFSVWVKNDEEGRNVLKLIAEKLSNLKQNE